MKMPTSPLRRALWLMQMCVLPLLMVFFLCPCGTIYNPKAPHGVKELSAVADGIGTAVVTPVVLVALPIIGLIDELNPATSSHKSARSEKSHKPGESETVDENRNHSVTAPK